MKKFYCQFCGTEVKLEDDICPSCHKEFDSVLCPKCNYSGNASGFYNGCPKCGYLKKVVHKKSRFTLKIFIILLVFLTSLAVILFNILIDY